jgi:hypothetical protein
MLRFTVRRLTQRRASPCSHGMPCRVFNIARRVDIGVTGETAGPAPEDGLALARPPIHDPTHRTTLTREPRIDLHHPPRRLVLQPGHQQPPPVGENPPVQARLLPHTPTRRIPAAPRPRLRQLAALLGEPWCGPAPRLPVGVLLHREIPHEPGMPTMLRQHPLLCRRRLETETGHADQPNDNHRQNRETLLKPDRPGQAQALAAGPIPIPPQCERRSILGRSR